MAWGNQGRGRGRGRGRGNSRGGSDEWKKVGQVALWENEGRGNAPVLTGTVELENGEKVNISLWESTSDNPDAPELVGTITRKVSGPTRGGQPQGPGYGAPESEYGEPDGYDDDIPF